jgi:hypothetical protein
LSETPDERLDKPSTCRVVSGSTDATTAGLGGSRKAKPGGKVIHLEDSLHARIRQHCDGRGVAMKQWVSDVLTAALQDDHKSEALDRRKSHVPVKRKRLTDAAQETGDEPWSRPPFWAKA